VLPVEPQPVERLTIDAALGRALDCLEALALLGEDIEDEWQYVQDLAETWRERLTEIAEARAGETLPSDRTAAIARACGEAELVTDPHRAIDWLSTFPQVVILAAGEPP
jgi:glucose-6-phosphate 1-dehydrogenase